MALRISTRCSRSSTKVLGLLSDFSRSAHGVPTECPRSAHGVPTESPTEWPREFHKGWPTPSTEFHQTLLVSNSPGHSLCQSSQGLALASNRRGCSLGLRVAVRHCGAPPGI